VATTLIDTAEYTVNEVYALQQTDFLEGAAAGASHGGIGVDNYPHQQLANRAAYLYNWLKREPYYAGDTGTVVNQYAVALTPVPANYAALAGVLLTLISARSNTGASTININGMGAIQIINPDGTQLLPAQITAGIPALLWINGVNAAVLIAGSRVGEFSSLTVQDGIQNNGGNIVAVYGRFRATYGAMFTGDPNVCPILNDFQMYPASNGYMIMPVSNNLGASAFVVQWGVLVIPLDGIPRVGAFPVSFDYAGRGGGALGMSCCCGYDSPYPTAQLGMQPLSPTQFGYTGVVGPGASTSPGLGTWWIATGYSA
jgi:hypothetical protein